MGLRVAPILGDGNCFFRAIAETIWGGQERHDELRKAAVAYMRQAAVALGEI